MKFSKTGTSILGVNLPIASLRTENSCGIGEFLDLLPFVDLCKKCGIGLIQILPVNDTGTDSSPYNAMSAFALHPIYISLEALIKTLKIDNSLIEEVNQIKKNHSHKSRFSYQQVLTEKLEVAKKIFSIDKNRFIAELEKSNSDESVWFEDNLWVKTYSVFKNLKAKNMQQGWQYWNAMRNPTKEEIQSAWNDPKNKQENTFNLWLQFHLHKQLLQASQYCQSNNLLLKGDIPIMLNEDSTDIWENHALFRMDLRAGSPPDGENAEGQNWGFPIYFWENHKEDDYSWWKSRLKKADQYYNAYRLDHILGFFRMWAVPKGETTAILGRAIPYEELTTDDLKDANFSSERIKWMAEPHIRTEEIMSVNSGDYLNSHGQLHKVASRIGEQELWLFKNTIKTESDIFSAGLKPEIEKKLSEKWKDRMLIKIGDSGFSDNSYAVAWNYKNTTAWNSFSETEKNHFNTLLKSEMKKAESIWKKNAQQILGSLCPSVDMLACAEDLGAVPDCVSEVLDEFGILSLKVMRWERDWKSKMKSFISMKDYKKQSVTMSSVHDSSTFEQWWNEELSQFEREDFLNAIDCLNEGYSLLPLSETSAHAILKAVLKTPSKICCLPIQDILTVIKDDLELTENQRINIPGTLDEFNWTYRMPLTIEKLAGNKRFINLLKALTN